MNNDTKLLYHYTSIQSANNIFRSSKLWASDARYLNDRNELTSAIKMLVRKFTNIKNFEQLLSVNNHFRYFCVFCLSSNPHVLSQWRSYGDDGAGICIGFAKKFLPMINNHKYPNMDLVECVYDNHEEFIEKMIEEERGSIEAVSDMCQRYEFGAPLFDALRENPKPLDRIYTQLLRIKNNAFAEEKESRLVFCVDSASIKTRTSNGVIIPYIEHQFHEDPFEDGRNLWCSIPQLWLGPKSDGRNQDALAAFNQFGWILGGVNDSLNGIFKYDCGYR